MTASRRHLLLASLGSLGLFGLGLGFASPLACTDTRPDLRPALVAAVAEQLRAELDTGEARAATLREACEALCAAPDDARLAAAREAWGQLRAPWKRLRALPIGPIVDEGFDSAIDFWPARPTNIEGAIEAQVASVAELEPFGVASKGLPAIEYLLWEPAGDDATVLASLTEPELGPGRCTYLAVLAADVELRLIELAAATDSFADELAAAESSTRYPTLALAVDELLNAALAGLHDISELALGKPLGLSTGTEPQLDQLESRFSDRSRQDILDALDGFARFYLGVEPEPGLSSLVRQDGAEIDARVRDQLDRTIAAVEAMAEPLGEILDTDPAAATAAWDAVRELRMLLAADVAGLLGVTVALTDNDGD